MTEAENKNVMKPLSFKCNTPPEQMLMVLKGLAIKKKTALELFQDYKGNQGGLKIEEFCKAC